jgi:hypothetical protein
MQVTVFIAVLTSSEVFHRFTVPASISYTSDVSLIMYFNISQTVTSSNVIANFLRDTRRVDKIGKGTMSKKNPYLRALHYAALSHPDNIRTAKAGRPMYSWSSYTRTKVTGKKNWFPSTKKIFSLNVTIMTPNIPRVFRSFIFFLTKN